MAAPGISPWSAATRLSAALEHHPAVTLILDDADALAPGPASDMLEILPGHLPAGSRMVLAARSSPSIDLARLRAAGTLLELGPDELALGDDEALALATGAGLVIDASGASTLNRQAEGWPAGLYLGIKAIQADRSTSPFGDVIAGDRRFVQEYLRSEILDGLPTDHLDLLRRTSFLERFNGSLCDAILDRSGSGSLLAEIERTNRFLIPLDDRGQWYRCHHLLRDVLRVDLAREATSSADLLGRASAWFEANELYEEAIDFAFGAGDAARIARLMTIHTLTLNNLGRTTTVRRLFDRLGNEAWIPEHPEVAVVAAIFFATTGDPRRAAQWQHRADGAPRDVAMPDGSPSIDSWLALLRAIMAQDGVDRLLADAMLAVSSIPSSSPWRTAALASLGIARYLAGDLDAADATFDEADAASMPPAAGTGRSIAMAYRAMIAMERGDWAAAGHHASTSRETAVRNNLTENSAAIMAYAVSARVSMRRGNRVQAEVDRAHANRLRPSLSTAMPWLAIGARLELARMCLAESDAAGARTLLREADEVLRAVPDLGRLTADVADVRRQAEDATGITIGASALTTAELRLLPIPRDPSVVPRDRRTPHRVAEHDQDAGHVGVSQARRHVAKRRRRPGGRHRPDRSDPRSDPLDEGLTRAVPADELRDGRGFRDGRLDWRPGRVGGLATEGDPDRLEPTADVPIDRRCPERHLLIQRPFDRVEDEGLGLRPTEAAVRADELLERGHLAELRVVLAEQQQVRGVGHRVLALEAHDRVRPEDRRRVLAFDPVLVEEPGALRSEDDRAEGLRADEQHPDTGMRRDRRDETRVQLLELLHREAVIVSGEPDQAQVPRADHRDRRGIGDGRSPPPRSRSTTPSRVRLARAARATVGPTPLLCVISDNSELTNVEPSALVFVSMRVARPLMSPRTNSPRLTP